MKLHANMIIFHAPDVLEFALDGRSLARVQVASARIVFQKITNMSDNKGPRIISDLYATIFAIPSPVTQRPERTESL